MIIKTVNLETVIGVTSKLPENHLPEFAFSGKSNVGKSSLTNALVGEKIAIVSNKPQTTRTRIRGVVNTGDTQLVLMDTPGLHKAQNRLGDYMVKVVENSLSDIDVVVMLVEPIAHVGKPEEILIERLKRSGEKAILVIN